MSVQNIRIEEIDLKDLVILSPGNCMRDQIIELCQARRSMPSHYSFESGFAGYAHADRRLHVVSDDHSRNGRRIHPLGPPRPAENRKGATSRKIAVAVRRTYVKNSIIRLDRDHSGQYSVRRQLPLF